MRFMKSEMKYPYKTGAITFPDDEGRHKDARIEWWYFNSHLRSGNKSFGLMFTFKKPNDIMYIIVSDNNKKIALSRVRNQCNFNILPDKLDINYGQNFWKQLDTRAFTYQIHIEEEDIEVDLQIEAIKTPAALGKNGIVKMGKGGDSFWYAQSRLEVKGSLEFDNKKFEVTGSGWIDRQWGNWNWFGFGKWRWFSIQLENGFELEIVNIFEPLTNRLLVSDIYLIDPSGYLKTYKKSKIKSLGKWKSPNSMRSYSLDWKIDIPEIKSELLVKPYFQNQEIHNGLWEGNCMVEGWLYGDRVKGSAYVELFHGMRLPFYKTAYFYLLSTLKNLKKDGKSKSLNKNQ